MQRKVDRSTWNPNYLSIKKIQEETKKIGLPIDFLEPEDDLWKMLWSLHCAYEVELRRSGMAKVVESDFVSFMY